MYTIFEILIIEEEEKIVSSVGMIFDVNDNCEIKFSYYLLHVPEDILECHICHCSLKTQKLTDGQVVIDFFITI